ncbi:MAG TPA: NADPH:quinone reductase [Burkholderiales bacterium]|nr:NADPH:quinone reductase [Burkholderiales bacterium]
MQAVWFERTGAAREVLVHGEMPDPQAGAGEVRVKIAYSGVNPSDVKRRGGFSGPIPFPRVIPDMDGSGVIDQVGAGVDPKRIGERVWLHSTAWKRPYGTAAQYAVTLSDRAYPLPANTPLSVGAGLGVPAMTAHRAVFGLGPVKGKTVLVTGGAGAVGFYAIQLAKWGGARVIATVSSEAKAAAAKRAGADAVINYKSEKVGERALSLTDGAGIDHVVEVDFGGNLAATLECIKLSGTIATYASMSAPQPAIPFYQIMPKNLNLLWVLVYDMPAQAMADAARDVNAWLAEGRAVHQIARTFPYTQFVDAHLVVERGGEIGKVIVEVGGG